MFWVGFAIRKLTVSVLTVVAAYYTVAPQVKKWLGPGPLAEAVNASAALVLLVGVIVVWDGVLEVLRNAKIDHARKCVSVMRSLIQQQLRLYIEEASQFDRTARLRANVMEMRWMRLRITERRNMEQCRDGALSFASGYGCCGRAFLERNALIADKTRGAADEYKLTRKQRKLVAPDRQWFFCVPIISGDHKRVVGILNLDSDIPLVNMDDKTEVDRLVRIGNYRASELLPLLRPEEGKR